MSKKVLIADDHDAVRAAVRNLVERQLGLTVCAEAVDGFDAIEKTKQLKPDLIFLDLVMPKLNGAAAASVLRQAVPSALIVLLTMYEEAVDVLGPAVGADAVLSKRDGLSDLLGHIQALLDARWGHEN